MIFSLKSAIRVRISGWLVNGEEPGAILAQGANSRGKAKLLDALRIIAQRGLMQGQPAARKEGEMAWENGWKALAVPEIRPATPEKAGLAIRHRLRKGRGAGPLGQAGFLFKPGSRAKASRPAFHFWMTGRGRRVFKASERALEEAERGRKDLRGAFWP
jgi:hypothetical protein